MKILRILEKVSVIMLLLGILLSIYTGNWGIVGVLTIAFIWGIINILKSKDKSDEKKAT
jgi:F0F1-type ATP synthase assembly protein I